MASVKFKFGTLQLTRKVGREYCWSGVAIECKNKKMKFEEQIPVNIFTKQKRLEPPLLQWIENVLSNVDSFLETAILYLKNTLLKNPSQYSIRNDELAELELDIYNFPVDLPAINFYENNEWMIRFATGRFNICDPYGVAVCFKENHPVSVEDLSESETID